MSKKYVVSYREGTDMRPAQIFDTKEEAEKAAEDFIYGAAYDAWDDLGCDGHPTHEELEEWAEDNGFVLSGTFFWDGGSDGFEALITEVEGPGFTVNVVTGDVFINGKFVSQLCWTNDAVGMAIAMWLNEQEGESNDC